MTALEKAARAAQEACRDADMSGYTRNYDLTDIRVDGDVDFISVARAVLMAVREPGEMAWDAGVPVHFTAVIDALLAEKPA